MLSSWKSSRASFLFGDDLYSRYFFERGGNECVAYHASWRAALTFGQATIIAVIETVAGQETGRFPRFNVDTVPIEGAS